MPLLSLGGGSPVRPPSKYAPDLLVLHMNVLFIILKTAILLHAPAAFTLFLLVLSIVVIIIIIIIPKSLCSSLFTSGCIILSKLVQCSVFS